MTRKGRSVAHEGTWLGIAGFILRPGYGAPNDSQRISELWKIDDLGLAFPKEANVVIQYWILWRRVAAGLDEKQQQKLFSRGEKLLTTPGAAEVYRALASFEKVELADKLRLARGIIKQANNSKATEAMLWSLGRISNRLSLQDAADKIIPPDEVYGWFEKLQSLDWSGGNSRFLTGAFKLAARVSPLAHHNLSPQQRESICSKLKSSGVTDEELKALYEYQPLQRSDEKALLGENLPAGLRMES